MGGAVSEIAVPSAPIQGIHHHVCCTKAFRRHTQEQEGPHRRNRRIWPQGTRGQGPHAQGRRPPLPQGLQEQGARRALRRQARHQHPARLRNRAAAAPADAEEQRRAGHRPQLGRGGAARRHPRQGPARSHPHRHGRARARIPEDRRRTRHPGDGNRQARAGPHDRRGHPPGPGPADPAVRLRRCAGDRQGHHRQVRKRATSTTPRCSLHWTASPIRATLAPSSVRPRRSAPTP